MGSTGLRWGEEVKVRKAKEGEGRVSFRKLPLRPARAEDNFLRSTGLISLT